MLDSAILCPADAAVVEETRPRSAARRVDATPAVLWRQTLAAHEPAAGHRWAARGCYTLLGTLSFASVAYAIIAVAHGVLAHDGLRAAVAHLMGR